MPTTADTVSNGNGTHRQMDRPLEGVNIKRQREEGNCNTCIGHDILYMDSTRPARRDAHKIEKKQSVNARAGIAGCSDEHAHARAGERSKASLLPPHTRAQASNDTQRDDA